MYILTNCSNKEIQPNNYFSAFSIDADNNEFSINIDDLLSEISSSQASNILFYIHGFNTLKDKVIANSQKIEKLLNNSDFLLIPIIWPSSRSLYEGQKPANALDERLSNELEKFKNLYQTDKHNAELCALAFKDFLQQIQNWSKSNSNGCFTNKKINILAHSAGCRVIVNAIFEILKDFPDLDSKEKFIDNVFLVAPELDYDVMHKGYPGYKLAELSRRVYVYFALNDLALIVSILGKEYEYADPIKQSLIDELLKLIINYIKIGNEFKENLLQIQLFLKDQNLGLKAKIYDFLYPLIIFIKSKPYQLLILVSSWIKIVNTKPCLGQVALKGMCNAEGKLKFACAVPSEVLANVILINCTGINQLYDRKLGHTYYREDDIYNNESQEQAGKIFQHIKERLENPQERILRFSSLTHEKSLFKKFSDYLMKIFRNYEING